MDENILFHKKSKEESLTILNSSEKGLSEKEAEKRLSQYGANVLTKKKKHTALSLFLNQFKNTLTLILLGAVFVTFFIYFFGNHEQSDLIEASLILAIVFMIAILGFFQEYKAEKAIESLKQLLAFKTKILRDGLEKEIDVTTLVPGDIVFLEEGMKIPADIRLLNVSNLQLNEASLTGESTSVMKHTDTVLESAQIADRHNMVFAGTNVASGRGNGIVVATGNHTEIGKIASFITSEPEEQTPLQKHLNQIGKKLGYIIMIICAIVFVFILFFTGDFQSISFTQKIIRSFIAAVALAVAAIPEGLPAVVTISLALGTQRMVKKNALIRKLSAVETLGSTDIICTDKTGTLTKNEMTVKEIFFDKKNFTLTGTGYETKGSFFDQNNEIDPQNLSLILEAGMYCNNATQTQETFLGDPTEIALLVSAKKAGFARHELDSGPNISSKEMLKPSDSAGRQVQHDNVERLLEIPFTSERKLMSVVVEQIDKIRIYVKGAPEEILSRCSKVQKSSKGVALLPGDNKLISETVISMSSRALRTIGFAYKDISKAEWEQYKDKPEILEQELIFIGIQGMIDPPREEVKDLISQCAKSGIRVIMITGDHLETAKAVAKEIGITGKTLTGVELDSMTEEEFFKIVEDIAVYARVNPGTKMRIVKALKKKGHIVAMTGDGVNDAPALKKADIGIAMGITGTDVAREAADMVLLDDKFSTIVSAIEEGRTIYSNIQKFIQYLLSCNIAEVIVIFFGILIFKDLPLTATMLLWINVVTDGLPAVALSLDKGDEKGMLESPEKYQKEIITKELWIEMFFFGSLLTIATLGIYYLNLVENVSEAKGAAFLAITLFELAALFVIRDEYKTKLFSNKWLWWSILITIVAQISIVYLPFLAKIFEVSYIDLIDWLYVVLGSVVLYFLTRVFRRNFTLEG